VKSYKILISFLFPLLVIAATNAKADPTIGGSIFLDHINTYQPGYIPTWVEANAPLVFHLGASNSTGGAVLIMRSAFEINSPDGAVWQPIDGAWTSALNWNSLFDGGVLASEFSANGSGADTASFVTFNLQGPGFPNATSAVAWTISTQVDASQVGKILCLDSVVDARGNDWLWTINSGNITPTWSGPHCFAIESDCCQGIRGDVNGDGTNSNVLDLNYLVNRIFRAGPLPPCALEADLNGDGTSGNITDLNYLVNFLYRGGPAGVACP